MSILQEQHPDTQERGMRWQPDQPERITLAKAGRRTRNTLGPRVLAAASVLLVAAFLYAFWLPWKTAPPENDMWWQFPAFAEAVQGKSPGQLLGYLLGPWPRSFGQPVLKVALYASTALFGPQVKPLIAAAILFHAVSAALLYGVCRGLRISARASILASLIHLTAFIHLHAFFFPSNFRHVFSVFTILLLLLMVLRADRAIQSGRLRRTVPSFWGALAAGLLASVQRSTVIAPAAILAHILLAPSSPQERVARVHRWLPLFILWMIYPTFMVSFVGDVIVNEAVARIAYPPALKWASLLALGGAALAGLSLLVRRLGVTPWRGKKVAFGVGLFLVALLWLLLVSKDKRQILFAYNALVPFWTSCTVLFDPLTAVMRLDAAQNNHYLQPWLPAWSGLLIGALGWIFWACFLRRKPQLWVWGAWYGVALIHLLKHYSSTPPAVPSRFFLYVTPVLAVMVGCGVTWITTWALHRMRAGLTSRDALLAGFLVAVALPNLAAIPLGQWRSRMANTYFVYDDLRAASLIRDDLEASAALFRLRPEGIAVQGVVEMPHREFNPTDFTIDPSRHDNFRLAVKWAFPRGVTPNVQVNRSWDELEHGTSAYILNGSRVLDPEGRSINPFDQQMASGIEHLQMGDLALARESFQSALKTRPFILQYLLGDLRLSDLRWLSKEEGLRAWLRRVSDLHLPAGEPPPKLARTRAVAEEEIWDVIVGLFLVSYVVEREGRVDEGQRWLAQIRFLEPDAELVRRRLQEHPWVRDLPEVEAHLQTLRHSVSFPEPIPWRKDDFGFERFLLRFLFGLDIRSGWERHPALGL